MPNDRVLETNYVAKRSLRHENTVSKHREPSPLSSKSASVASFARLILQRIIFPRNITANLS